MSICISFEGRLDAPGRVGELVDFLMTEAQRRRWPFELVYHHVSGVLPSEAGGLLLIEEYVQGIELRPFGSEGLQMLCNREGVFTRYVEIPHTLIGSPVPDSEACYLQAPNWVRSTHPDGHTAIAGILRGVKDRFASDLCVDDDTGYWDTADEQSLRFSYHMMSSVASAIATPAAIEHLARTLGPPPLVPRLRIVH
ncbi:MAG: hypothetical protein R2729_10410 [Bryobacteraceae bacterium]